MKEQQMMVIGTLFVLNMIGNSLVSTGAFEIQFNNKLQYSKLETGKIPDFQLILRKLREFSREQQKLTQ